MADKGKQKRTKKQQDFNEWATEVSTRNRAGLGWKPEDFGIFQINPAVGTGSGAARFEPGRTGSNVVANTGGVPGTINNPATTNASLPTKGVLPASTPASSFLKPEEQAQVQKYMQNPEAVALGSGPIEATKRFLGNLFDTTDTYAPDKQTAANPTGYQGGDNVVETVWDSLLGGLGWGYNRLSQATVAGLSGLPGGTRTLSWDEANDVSVGQMVVGGIGESMGRVRRGEGSAGDLFAMFATPINQIGSAVGSFYKDSPLQQAGFDITNPEDRKAFEQGPEKFFSGVTDFGFVFADPLILGGKAAKLARMKWIDRPMDTPQARAILKEELAAGNAAIIARETGNTATSARMAPSAMFIDWVTQKAPDGKKIRTFREVFSHPELKYAANRDQVARALYNAKDFETGALIYRYAKGDVEAGAELFTKRADVVDGMAAQERERIMRIHAMNPDAALRTEALISKSLDKAQQRIVDLANQGRKGTDEYNLAVKYFDNLNDTWLDISQGRFDPVSMATPEGVAAAREVFTAIMKNDDVLAKAIGDERSRVAGIWGSMSQRNGLKGSPSNTALGRAVERSRERRATAAYQAASSRGAFVETGKDIVRADGSTAAEMKPRRGPGKGYWQRDVYGKNGFTRSVRLWRWNGEENPLGYITTRGIGAQESTREVIAVVDDVPIYSGPPRKITLPEIKDADGNIVRKEQEILVGGVDRKNQLIQMYADALEDTTAGADAAAVALKRIEDMIANDIMAWHGVPKGLKDKVIAKAMRAKEDTIASLADEKRRFFLDADGEFDAVPWLEQHLQNGTYMLNYRALEKAARSFDEQGLIQFADSAGNYAGQNFMRAYKVFNDVWRPAVLLRLGYAMRNTIEGQFRAAAFTQSVDPARYGVENGYLTLRSSRASFAGRKVLKKAENVARLRAAGNNSVQYPKKYQRWLADQIVARENETGRIESLIRNVGEPLAAMSTTYRDWMIDFYKGVQDNAISGVIRAKANGASADEIAALLADRDDAQNALLRLTKIKPADEINEFSEITFEQLRAHKTMLDESIAARGRLDDDMQALAMFKQQGRAKQRIFSKAITGPDGRVLQNAFMSDNPFTPVSLSLLSADTTQQSMLSLSMDMSQNLFKAIRQQNYVSVTPDMPKYFDGLSVTVDNIRKSFIGQRLLKGMDEETIARELLSDADGREVLEFMRESRGMGSKIDSDMALEAVELVRDRFLQIVPSPEIRAYVRNGGDISPDALKALAKPQADGKFGEPLAAIVGNVAEEIGTKSVMDTWRAATSWTMKWLGTFTEDTFVRQPFYGTRYNQVLLGLYNDLKAQVGDTVSLAELNDLYVLAHKQALKDTKDWLYTIERRTNLGTYGEMAIPFVSAFQNSTTTVGRLVWNDPTTAAIAVDMWRAPAAAGFEDEEGNIVIPLPKDMIPDGLEKALGLENMTDWKINKSSLNVVMPESGFGFVPRPGPLVGVAASELMKSGFGLTVESPEVMRAMFGKEGADQVWNVFKNYMFGEGQGVAPDAGSLSMLTPPIAAKVIQMIQGEDNATYGYYYNLIQRTEWLNYLGGKRDEMPDPGELQRSTLGLYMTRLLGNLFAITPPQYATTVDPLINQIRKIKQQNPQDADRIIYQTYGPLLTMLGDFSNSKNMAGMMPTADAVEIARKHSGLINQVSPGLERMGDLSVLSMLTMNGKASSLYDDSAYGWQFANAIPGVSVNFRERQTPEQSWAQSRINIGWTEYLSMDDSIRARLEERGLSSLRQAPDLKAERDAKLAEMAANPLYKEWWQDYREFGSSRTLSAVSVMEAALANPDFMKEYGQTDVWVSAREYLHHRNEVMRMLKEPGRSGSIDSAENADIRQYWDDARAYLNQNKEWSAVSSRFLNGDENPEEPGVQLASYYEVSGVGANNGS